MKRVLIISYYWPPAGGSGVQRWVKFAKYLPFNGWQPVIYTPSNPEISSVDDTLSKEIPTKAEILKRRIVEPYGIYRFIMGSKSSTDMKTLISEKGEVAATGGEVNPINGEKKSFKQNLSLFIRGNCFIPDPRVWWVKPSVKYLEKYLAKHPVDVIVSSGPPHSMHLIGHELSQRTGIPWIPDFRDPWTKMYYFKNLRLTRASERKHMKLEQMVLDDAAAVLSVTPFVQRDFQARTKTPVAMITNGFDPSDFAAAEPHKDGFFNIVHTGLFAVDSDPEELWKILQAKCAENEEFRSKLRLRLVGKVDEEIVTSIKAHGLDGNIVRLGYLPHGKAVSEQKGADLLLLPLRNDPEYAMILPGKLFEYLAASRPVLGLGQEKGAMAQVLEETGAGVMCDWDNADRMRAAVDSAWNRYCAGVTDYETVNIEKYTREATTKELVALFEQVLNK